MESPRSSLNVDPVERGASRGGWFQIASEFPRRDRDQGTRHAPSVSQSLCAPLMVEAAIQTPFGPANAGLKAMFRLTINCDPFDTKLLPCADTVH